MRDLEPVLAASPMRTAFDRRPSSEPSRAERLRAGDGKAMAEIFGADVDLLDNYCYRRTGS